MSPRHAGLHELSFRARYERARKLPLPQQIQECAEYLENPDILAAEVVESYLQTELRAGPDLGPLGAPVEEGELTLEFFSPGIDVSIEGDEISVFRVVANDVDPLPRPDGEAPGVRLGLDYVGLAGDGSLAFGAAASDAEVTPYLLLLRGLNALAELAPASQRERLASTLAAGPLPDPPEVDLHMVTWGAQEDAGFVQLAQLSRDLADLVRRELAGAEEFPNLLRRVLSLRMDPEDFDGRLYLDWII